MNVNFAVMRVAASLLLAACVCAPVLAQTKDIERTGGPYVPTPQVVVDQMLRFGSVKESDYVMDLGSGDGVIVLTAARQMKASGMGLEIDPELVERANNTAKKFGVADRATFRAQDVFKFGSDRNVGCSKLRIVRP